jgi:hypothetical protein
VGIASSLFFSTDPEKQTLHRRITPTEEQYSEQQERWNALAEFLISELGEKTTRPVRTWLQGSYKFRTQIRPPRKGDEFDIDLGIYIQWSGNAEEGALKALDIKNFVQDALAGYTADDVVEVVRPPKPRCCRIRFKGDFHIDVPAYHLDPDSDTRRLATQEGKWESSDPKALYLWFKNLFDDDARSRARRQIRYVKSWATLKFENIEERPSSILLTVLVAEACRAIDAPDISDDDLLGSTLDYLVDRLMKDRSVLNPVDKSESLSQRFGDDNVTILIAKLTEFRDTARRAGSSDSVAAAAEIWSECFEHFFPMVAEEPLAKAVHSEGFVPAPVFLPDVHVRAISKDNKNMQWNGRNKIGPIPKNCEIYFDIINSAALPSGAHIEWMVRNEGAEAENTNDLGHRAGSGMKARESSAYVGIHFMDCIAKRGSAVIGLRRVPVTIAGTYVPRRFSSRR